MILRPYRYIGRLRSRIESLCRMMDRQAAEIQWLRETLEKTEPNVGWVRHERGRPHLGHFPWPPAVTDDRVPGGIAVITSGDEAEYVRILP